MMEAVLSNADHPEYGVATIPLPIPRNQYDHCVALLEALEIGDASEADCRLDSLDSAWPVLNRLVCTKVNLDELDYLAKRLDSFDVGEFSQFQAMAEKLNLTSMKDLINLTFCCQQATVITDFTNLKEIGRDHYMNIHGGCASMEELEQLDGEETAILLIEDNEGTITRYGVVYDNGMQLSQLYDGKHLPCYHYEADMTAVGISSRQEPENSKNVTWVYGSSTGTEDWIPGAEVPFIGADGFCSPIGSGWESRVTSEFGYRRDPFTGETRGHTGIDIAVPTGTPVRAALPGVVTTATYNAGGYGYYVMIDHGNGMVTLYAHCSKLLARVGSTVEAGDIVSLSGSTGRSTGPHLHFEVRINGQRVNPRSYLPTN